MSTETAELAMAGQDQDESHANVHTGEPTFIAGGGPADAPPAPTEYQKKAPDGLAGIVEALLFASGEPLSVDRLAGVVEGASRVELKDALVALQADYGVEGGGLQIVEVAGGFQITTRVDCAPWIKRLDRAKGGAKLSRSAMETLAIVAYKQPLVRAEIEQIRGVDTAGVLKTLLDRRLIRIVGRKDIPGRPIMYGTTKQFLQSFGLKDLASLPALREIKELAEGELPLLPDAERGFGSAVDGNPEGVNERHASLEPTPEPVG